MELVVLIQESVKVVCRGAAAVPVFFFSHPDFDDSGFYAAKQYTHEVQEGYEEYLFDIPVPSVRCARQSVSAPVNKEQVEGENIGTDLPSILSGQRGNLNDDYMKRLLEEGFDVDNDNLPNLENVSNLTPVAINAHPVFNWKTNCVVCL